MVKAMKEMVDVTKTGDLMAGMVFSAAKKIISAAEAILAVAKTMVFVRKIIIA